MNKALIVITVLVLASFVGYSEPTPSVSWLMNEPVTLFDLGIWRLRLANDMSFVRLLTANPAIKRYGFSAAGRSNVFYVWDDNEIVIMADLDGKSATEEECVTTWNLYVMLITGVYPPGRSEPKDATAIMGHYFSHIGFKNSRRPDDLDRNLLNLFRFVVRLTLTDKDGIPIEKDPVIIISGKVTDDYPTLQKLDRYPSKYERRY
jgi:hypothetical protein